MAAMRKITPEHYAMAYYLGREVYHERLSYTEAVAKLADIGMNKTSASFSIGNLRQMINGAAYHRAMSNEQTRYFLDSIQQDDGLPGLKKAVAAFAEHLPYLRKSNQNRMPGLTALLAEYAARLEENPAETDAVDDLIDKPEGNSSPDRAARTGSYFRRDPKIRAHLVKRANGKCEFCGRAGFLMPDGNRYIETHHIIGLAKQGPDTLANVICLCADHHRESHFGVNASQLEAKFSAILATPIKRQTLG